MMEEKFTCGSCQLGTEHKLFGNGIKPGTYIISCPFDTNYYHDPDDPCIHERECRLAFLNDHETGDE